MKIFQSVLATVASLYTLSSAQYLNETRLLRATGAHPEKSVGAAPKADNSKLKLHPEKLAELYYQNQIKERDIPVTYRNFFRLNANYPCFFGTYPVGADTPESVIDGHKYVCGLPHIDSSPIVYSFGSNQKHKISNYRY